MFERLYVLSMGIASLEDQRRLVLLLLILSVAALILMLVSLRRQLRKRTNQLLRSEQAFFGMVHDLKTPLAAAYADLRHLSETETDLDRALALEDSAERINLISDKVKRLLKLPRLLQDGKISDAQEFNLLSLLVPVESELEVSYPEKQIEFVHAVSSELVIKAPKEEVEALMRILMENAVKYSGEEPVVTLSVHDPAGQCAVLVQDNGPGLGIETNNYWIRLTAGTMPREVSGNGIGLLYAIRLAEDMKAVLMCKSTQQGTSIALVLKPQQRKKRLRDIWTRQ